jgi:hypothetical protein
MSIVTGQRPFRRLALQATVWLLSVPAVAFAADDFLGPAAVREGAEALVWNMKTTVRHDRTRRDPFRHVGRSDVQPYRR